MNRRDFVRKTLATIGLASMPSLLVASPPKQTMSDVIQSYRYSCIVMSSGANYDTEFSELIDNIAKSAALHPRVLVACPSVNLCSMFSYRLEDKFQKCWFRRTADLCEIKLVNEHVIRMMPLDSGHKCRGFRANQIFFCGVCSNPAWEYAMSGLGGESVVIAESRSPHIEAIASSFRKFGYLSKHGVWESEA